MKGEKMNPKTLIRKTNLSELKPKEKPRQTLRKSFDVQKIIAKYQRRKKRNNWLRFIITVLALALIVVAVYLLIKEK